MKDLKMELFDLFDDDGDGFVHGLGDNKSCCYSCLTFLLHHWMMIYSHCHGCLFFAFRMYVLYSISVERTTEVTVLYGCKLMHMYNTGIQK